MGSARTVHPDVRLCWWGVVQAHHAQDSHRGAQYHPGQGQLHAGAHQCPDQPCQRPSVPPLPRLRIEIG